MTESGFAKVRPLRVRAALALLISCKDCGAKAGRPCTDYPGTAVLYIAGPHEARLP